MNRCTFGLLFAALSLAILPDVHTHPVTNRPTVMARVELVADAGTFPLPIHGFLQDASGIDYLLVFATEAELRQTQWPWRHLASSIEPGEVVIALEMRAGAREQAKLLTPLYDDGLNLFFRIEPSISEQLDTLGFSLQRIENDPIALGTLAPPKGKHPEPQLDPPPPILMPHPHVAAMMARVETTNLWWMLRRLTGKEPVIVAGEARTTATRHTASGEPIRLATEMVYERLKAIGLQVAYHSWTNAPYTNRNVIATLPGTSRSNEFVLITAHLDNLPSGIRAPGADDNATGTAAVLTAAGVFSQFRFERSIRFALFTGEEQGLYGSAKYASFAQSNGDNIAGVINLDMLGWNSNAPATLQLHVRTTSNPGFSNDLALASVFTNVATAYGLVPDVVPQIKADGMGQSDHAPFWNRGYPALLVIEDYPVDFTPHYHTVKDTVDSINMGYFTAAVRASIGAVAHLASPLSEVSSGAIGAATGSWEPGSGCGTEVFVARHLPNVLEALDDQDLASANPPPGSKGWFQNRTASTGPDLVVDSRPLESTSSFVLKLAAYPAGSGTLSSGNSVQFEFLSPPLPDRIYHATIRLPIADFVCVTNLRSLVRQGGRIALPPLESFAGGQYGTCEISVGLLDPTSKLRVQAQDGSSLLFVTEAQVGTTVVDTLESSVSSIPSSWTPLHSYTNEVIADTASFETGVKTLLYPIHIDTRGAPQQFFRLKRFWISQ